MGITKCAMEGVEGDPSDILEKRITMLTELVDLLEDNYRVTVNRHDEQLKHLFDLRRNTDLVESMSCSCRCNN